MIRRISSETFFKEILERENIRQGISASWQDLHTAFEQVAVAMENKFELSDLQCVNLPGEREISSADIDRMKDHAFIARTQDSLPHYQFKHEYLAYYLKASYVYGVLNRNNSAQDFIKQYHADRDLQNLIESECEGGRQLPERVADFLDYHHLDIVADICKTANMLDLRDRRLKSFLFHVVVQTVRLRGKKQDKSDRASKVIEVLGGDVHQKIVSGLCVHGRIAEISMRGWTVQKSRFFRFSLDDGKDKPPNFIECYFEGVLDVPRGCGFQQCKGDRDAGIVVRDKNADISEDDLIDHLKIVLGRFWGTNVRTINHAEWKTGRTKHIEDRFSVLAKMEKSELVSITKPAGIKKIKVSPDAIGDLRNFTENGQIRGRVRQILDALKQDMGV